MTHFTRGKATGMLFGYEVANTDPPTEADHEAARELERLAIEAEKNPNPKRKHFYACSSTDGDRPDPLGYVQAYELSEAAGLANTRWPDVKTFEIHRWDGVL